MRKPFVAGNWKMHKTVGEARQLLAEMLAGLQAVHGVEKVLCPPFTNLSDMARLLEGTGVGLGAQNLFWEASGAFTGEISPMMVAEFCKFVIIGHSERRAYFGETDESVKRRVHAALAHGLTPIVCVGETLEENETGRTDEVISVQMQDGLRGIDASQGQSLVIAYEPVWAIGTGRAATADGANGIIRDIVRRVLKDLFDAKVAEAVRVLYGGSVKANNAAEFFAQANIDGALVGGASLIADEFINIVSAAVPS